MGKSRPSTDASRKACSRSSRSRTRLAAVRAAYEQAQDGLTNGALYDAFGVDRDARDPVGRSGKRHQLKARELRWHQQTLRRLNVLEHVPGQRGCWRLTPEAMGEDRVAKLGSILVVCSTDLGVAIWADFSSVLDSLGESVALTLCSPPYPLRKPRAYGNPDAADYVDFICRAIEPILKWLIPGGTIALNVSNDIFEPGTPARSLYRERLVIAMADRLGLSKLDELVWSTPDKAPGPVQWASKTRQQLNVGYEPVYLFTNDPLASIADNRRVLAPHSERHRALIAAGGERRVRSNSDGAYQLRHGSYARETSGRIPRNVLTFGHACRSQRLVKQAARDRGLQVHGAPMPLALADFLVRYLSRPGDLVLDPMAGTLTTGEAAERNGRRWLCIERIWDYLAAGAHRFGLG